MPLATQTTKKEIHSLIELIPENETSTVKAFIEFIITKNRPKAKKSNSDSFAAFLESRPEGEPLTEKELRELRKEEQEIKQGKYVTLTEIRKRREKVK